MQHADGIRRNGYVIATALALIGLFVLMVGDAWRAAGFVVAAATTVGVVERIAELRSRKSQV